jgi:hypothetical protein
METAEAIADATSGYEHCPPSIDGVKWAVERETVMALIAGHAWRYGNDELEIVEVERPFEIPLRNPKTGAASRTFLLAGKIDAIGRLPDGRYVVVEYKTTGDDIAPGAMYWLRLRHDPQISLYVLAARELGYDVSEVFYDVCRKPTIRLKKTETPEEYGQRLWEDITSVRPDSLLPASRDPAARRRARGLRDRRVGPGQAADGRPPAQAVVPQRVPLDLRLLRLLRDLPERADASIRTRRPRASAWPKPHTPN